MTSFAQAWIDHLNSKRLGQTPTTKRDNETPLETLRTWWENLPDVERNRPYFTMSFFRYHFAASPALIGSLLYQLGFKKSRIWRVDGPQTRIWIPPKESSRS